MVIQCTAVIVLITLLSSTFGSYWGDIPETREVVQLSADTWEASSLEVKLHSQSLGRLILDTRLNREAVIGGAKKHAVTHNTRIQDELNTGCHYRGTVRDKPQYLVMLSTCSGRIRGSLTDVNSTWYVVYDKESYVMFSDSDLPNPYGIATGEYNGVELNHSISRPVSYHPLYKRGLSTDPIIATHKTVEVVVVTDRSFWQQFDTKIEEVEEFVLATVAKIDEIYKKYGVRIALVGMENWRVADMITVTPSYSATLRNFTMYRQEKLLNVYKQHDVSILMTAVDFDGAVIGYAGVDTMCRSSCASVNFNSRKSVDFYASVIAHEMGHNFGMYHDSEECVCPPEISWDCLMSDSMGKASSIFSNCSQLVLNSFTGTCLNNQPKTLYGDPVCGNGFVEEGEECDCGTEEECIASDPCCEPIGCKLKPGAKCYSGDCCEECQFVSYKRMCRPASSECDLVEFCTGTNSQCPTNRYTQDGTLCGEGSGFCNYGSCQTLGTQCTSLWGEGVAVSDSACYDRFNRKGEWYGNCGSLGDRKFLACMDRDVFCGKLYCEVAEGRTTNLRHVYRSDLHYNSTYECTLAAGPRSIESQDVAMVYDGTKCGDSKWCIAGQCVEFEKVACPSPGGVECGGQGNCNDLNQCHCNAGYDPEFNCSVLLQVAGWDLKTILIAVMIIVLVVIPSCIITLLLCRRYNPKVKEFFDHHTQIRFSIHLPSISRRPSYLRRSSKRSNPDSSKTANGKTTAKPGTTNPPPRPVKLPSTSSTGNEPPPRPPGSYLTSTGWTTSAFNAGARPSSTSGGSRHPSTASGGPPPRSSTISGAPPSRPAATYQKNSAGNPVSVIYRPEPLVSQEGDQPASYVPLNMHPVRPAPPRPGGISTAPRPSSQSYDSPISKRPLANKRSTSDVSGMRQIKYERGLNAKEGRTLSEIGRICLVRSAHRRASSGSRISLSSLSSSSLNRLPLRDLHTFGPPSRSVPTVHRGPKALQATTRDNVKMDISGPGSARKLLDDKPLNERELAGSPLRDLLAKR